MNVVSEAKDRIVVGRDAPTERWTGLPDELQP